MPVAPTLDQKPQAAYVTAASVPSQYPATNTLIWTSYERLQDQLPEGEEIRQRADGAWERPIVIHTGESTVDAGVLKHFRRRVWRRVALSLAEARLLSGKGEETDFWNGWTWIRRGQKPERDWAVMQAKNEPEDVFLEDAPPADQAVAAAVIAQQTAATSSRLIAAEAAAPKRGRADRGAVVADPAPDTEQE